MTGPQDPHSPYPYDPGTQQYGEAYQQYPQQYQPQYQQPYQQQQYPQQYQQQYPQAPQRWHERLGPRVLVRPAPRLGVSLAGVGVLLAVLGVVAWGGSYVSEGQASSITSGHPGSSSRHFLGALLALVVVAIGYALLITARRGALATAGIAASALGVPVAMEFLTYDASSGSPINTDATVWVSIIVYAISYLFVRGARGHTFYVGASLVLFWSYVLDKVAPSTSEFVRGFGGSVVPGTSFGGGGVPSLSTVAGVSLVIGAVYYAIGWGLDRARRRGVAVAFVVAGFPAVAVGIGTLAQDVKQIGTGFVLIIVGIVIALYGARYDRRFTTWVWAVGAALGGVFIVQKLTNEATGAEVGISLIALGAVFVVGAALLSAFLDEPEDVVAPADVR
jgi:hypothetical protein